MSNNKYIIRVGHPILRPGLTIETEASEAYVVDTMQVTMDIARSFNHPTPPEPPEPLDYRALVTDAIERANALDAMPEQAGASIAECDDINRAREDEELASGPHSVPWDGRVTVTPTKETEDRGPYEMPETQKKIDAAGAFRNALKRAQKWRNL